MELVRIAFVIALAACGGGGDDVEVRVCNRTGYAVTKLAASEFIDRSLADGECTEYVEPKHDAYRYTFADFMVGIDRFAWFPIDYVGETPLSAGRWSYELRIRDYAMRSGTVNAVEDEPSLER